jgi:GLPGLI family protein
MKKICLSALVWAIAFVVSYAQNNEGAITFEEKMNLHRRIQNEQQKAMIPEFRTSTMMLYFRGDECIYKKNPDDEDDEVNTQSMGGGGGRMMMMRFGSNEIYSNYATQTRLMEQEFMGKKYLISDTLKQSAWKLGTETKKIAGYDCTKATLSDTARKTETVAWFTMDIPLTAGPGGIGMLPGMILELDVNNGEMTRVAKVVEFKKQKDSNLKAPSKGEKITQAEFRQKMDEFRKQNGGRNIQIRMN